MSKEITNKLINSLLNDLEKTKNGLESLRFIDSKKHPWNYEELSTDIALHFEKMTCNARKLVYKRLVIYNYLEKASDVLNIKINFTNHIYEIEIPALIPKKNKKMSSDFIVAPLSHKIETYIIENNIEAYDNAVICFNHVYDESLEKNRIRDYDNIDLKRILDLLSIHFLKDDSGYYIDVFNTTSYGKNDLTKISIMERKHFQKWLELNHKDT